MINQKRNYTVVELKPYFSDLILRSLFKKKLSLSSVCLTVLDIRTRRRASRKVRPWWQNEN
jgi:hypothetical protein